MSRKDSYTTPSVTIAEGAKVTNDLTYQQQWAGIEIVSNSAQETRKLIDGLSRIPSHQLQSLTQGVQFKEQLQLIGNNAKITGKISIIRKSAGIKIELISDVHADSLEVLLDQHFQHQLEALRAALTACFDKLLASKETQKTLKVLGQATLESNTSPIISELNMTREGFQKIYQEAPELALLLLNRTLPTQATTLHQKQLFGTSLIEQLGVDELVVNQQGTVVARQAAQMSRINLTETQLVPQPSQPQAATPAVSAGSHQSDDIADLSPLTMSTKLNRVLVVAQRCLASNVGTKYRQAAECYGLVKALLKQWPKADNDKADRAEYKKKIQQATLNLLQDFIIHGLRLALNMQVSHLEVRLRGYSTALWHLHQPLEDSDNPKAWVTHKTEKLTQLFCDVITFCLDMLGISHEERQTDLAIVSLGSLATGMATGYSDIEYLILLSPYRVQANRAKLQGLADLVQLLMISLGETPISAAESLLRSEFQPDTQQCDELLTAVIRQGVRIDTAKHPLARNYVIELTGRVDTYLSQEAQQLFRPDNYTASSLLSPGFVLGNKQLFVELQSSIDQHLRHGHYQTFLLHLWSHDDQQFRNNVIAPLNKQIVKKQHSKKWQPKALLLYPLCLLRDTYWSLMHSARFDKPLISNTWAMLETLKPILPDYLPDGARSLLESWETLLKLGLSLRLARESEAQRSNAEMTLAELQEKCPGLIDELNKFSNYLAPLIRMCEEMIQSVQIVTEDSTTIRSVTASASQVTLNVSGKMTGGQHIEAQGGEVSAQAFNEMFPNVDDRIKALTSVVSAPLMTPSGGAPSFWQSLPPDTNINVGRKGSLVGGNKIKSTGLKITSETPKKTKDFTERAEKNNPKESPSSLIDNGKSLQRKVQLTGGEARINRDNHTLSLSQAKTTFKKSASTFLYGLPPSNVHFTGRILQLKLIAMQLQERQTGVITQIVSGLGGVGKSSLVLEYAHCARNRRTIKENDNDIKAVTPQYYDCILWLSGKDPLTAIVNFARESLSVELGDYKNDQKVLESLVNRVYRELDNRYKNILLVWDDVKTQETIQPYLPAEVFSQGIIHILMTTRSALWRTQRLIELDTFALDEGVSYIVGLLPTESRKVAEQLAICLHRFPLALSQAVAYILDMECGIEGEEGYLALCADQKNKLELLKENPLPQGRYKETVYATWYLSISALRNDYPKAEYILNLCAFFASKNIPSQLIKQAFSLTPIEYNKLFRTLRKYSLITPSEQGQACFSVHQLLQEVIRLHLNEQAMSDNGVGAMTVTTAPAAIDVNDATLQDYWLICAAKSLANLYRWVPGELDVSTGILEGINHFEAVIENLNLTEHRLDPMIHLTLLSQLITNKLFLGLYKDDIVSQSLQTAFDLINSIKVQMLSADNLSGYIVNCLNIKAKIQLHFSEFTAAKESLKQALDYVVANPLRMKTLILLASAARKLNLLELLDKCISKANSLLRESNDIPYNIIAEYYFELSQIKDAGDEDPMPSIECCLEAWKKYSVRPCIGMVKCYNKSAEIYRNRGEYTKAMRSCEHSLQVQELIYSGLDNSPYYAGTLNLSGLIKLSQDKLNEALNDFKTALKKWTHQNRRHFIAAVENNIGRVMYERGDTAIALFHYKKSIAIKRQLYSESHPEMAFAYHNLAALFAKCNRYTMAIKYYDKAISIRLKQYRYKSHPLLAKSVFGLFRAYDKIANYRRTTSSEIRQSLANKPMLQFWNQIRNNSPELIDTSTPQELLEMYLSLQSKKEHK